MKMDTSDYGEKKREGEASQKQQHFRGLIETSLGVIYWAALEEKSTHKNL